MAKKQVVRLPDEDPPPYTCGTCWFYEPEELHHGACYGVPPTPVVDPSDNDVMYPRPIVFHEDRGCSLWKARHSA